MKCRASEIAQLVKVLTLYVANLAICMVPRPSGSDPYAQNQASPEHRWMDVAGEKKPDPL